MTGTSNGVQNLKTNYMHISILERKYHFSMRIRLNERRELNITLVKRFHNTVESEFLLRNGIRFQMCIDH